MRHYNFLTSEQNSKLFLTEPQSFDFTADRDLLSASLGGTLYCPAIRDNLFEDIVKMGNRGASSLVVCLEDSIPDNRLDEAEAKLTLLLKALKERGTVDDLPLLFVRVRTPEHFQRVAEQNKGLLDSLTGFVFPKFEDATGVASHFISNLRAVNKQYDRDLYFMPVLESPSIVHRETRDGVLHGLKSVLDANRDILLAVRIGATDMSSVYGIRRPADFTVYDVHVLASAIADIVNVFGRASDGYTITGAVWEHFSNERIFKPQLRETLFADDKKLRRQLLTSGDDTFIREIQLDRANGINGKTIIHPSHIKLVHALSVVTHEEYSDALTITNGDNATGGATASFYRNKMNEIKPHLAWAYKTLHRAEAFGVANSEVDFVDFLEASTQL